MSSDPGVPLTDAYRILRRTSPPEAPFSGVVAARSDGETVLLVDADSLADWMGWRAAPDGHVLAARDVVRCADGLALEIDRCTERVVKLLERRASAGHPVGPGEAVTVAVSAIRGLVELAAAAARDDPPDGSWWLTASGRPVFVSAGAGAGPAVSETRAMLDSLARASADAAATRAIADVAGRLDDLRGFLHDAGSLEETLFALAEPAALEMRVVEARLRDTAATAPVPAIALRHGPASADVARRPHHGILAGEFGDSIAALLSELRRRVTDLAGGRRRTRPWLVGGAVAAVVLVGGALWPVATDTPAARGAGAVSPSPHPTPQASASTPRASMPDTAGAEPSPTSPADLATAASAVLDHRRACADELDCLADVLEDPAAQFPPGVVDRPAGERIVTLLDEFGGAAVLRVEGSEGTGDDAAQLVVIVAGPSGWLLRDVHDVGAEK